MSASASASKPAPGERGRRRRGARPDQTVKNIPLACGGTRRERYDLLGRLLWQEEPDGSWLRFRYGIDGQLSSVEHSSGERVTYEADAGGREWRARTARTETVIRFAADGLPRETVLRIDGHEWAVCYERDERGGVAALRYPQASDWTRIDREEAGGVKRLTYGCGAREYCRVESDAAAGVSTVAYANGAGTREEFDAASLRLRRVAAYGRGDHPAREIRYVYDEGGRLSRAGAQTYTYDELGRLASCAEGGVTAAYEYDEAGRMRRCGPGGSPREFGYGEGPAVLEVSGEEGARAAFEYDTLGRRTVRRDARGATRYHYNLFGHLARVELPGGAEVRYVYDGCGRLVAREAGGDCEYYVPGLDGQRLAAADRSGRVRDSYLWLAHQCLGRVAGAMGGPLAESYHRAHGGHLAGAGDASGSVRAVTHSDPFGSDAPVDGRTPAFAGLFGDPATGLVYASARWLDPSVAQFITPDSWFGADPARQLPARLRRVMRVTPGGAVQIDSPAEAYNWCRHDPVNFTDWNGHDGGRIVWSIISMLIWEQQLTVASLQLWVIDIILDILQVIVFRPAWDTAGYWHSSAFNLSAPIGSSRLGSFALVLNGLLMGERAFTLGNVVWARNSELTDAENLGKRTLLMCSNADTYLASVNALYSTNFVKAEAGGNILARTITFIRGQAIHFVRQFPDSFPASSIDVREYATAAPPKSLNGLDFPVEQTVIRMARDSDLTGYAAGNFVRVSGASIGSGPTPTVPAPFFFARLVDRTRAPRDLVLDATLPTATYTNLGVVKMDSNGAAQAGQAVPTDSAGAAVADRVGVGNRTDLRRLQGLSVTDAGGTAERRIVTGIVLDCTVAALPAGLAGSVRVEHMNALDTPATRARAKMSGATGLVIKLDAGETTAFTPGQAVQVDVTGGGGGANRAFGVVQTFAGGDITLAEAIPRPPFNDNVAVTVFHMTPTGATLNAADIAAGATHVFAEVELPTALAQNDIIRVRPAAGASGGALRLLATAPSVVAVLDSALPASHRANLSVQVFAPDISTDVAGAAAPPLRARLVVPTGTANPYAANDELFITDRSEEVYGKVLRVSGQDVFLETPVPWPMTLPVSAQAISPTGQGTPDGRLDESVVVVPADPSIELTRRASLEEHELRHVWQEAVCGPFFFSFPIPWLVNLGFSFSRSAHSASQVLRHISLGGLDSVFAGIVYGVGGFFKAMGSGFRDFSSHFESGTVVTGEVDEARKVITLAEPTAEQLGKLSQGTYLTVRLGETEVFNIVDALNAEERKVTLRFALEAELIPGDRRVSAAYSPFDNLRKQISKWFSLNIGQHIADHIPQAWGRVLVNFFNRESWFPWFGVYPWALMLAGFDQTRVAPEQDAAWHSGDLYTNIPVAIPATIYQGHFTRLFAFIQTRESRGIVTEADPSLRLSTLLQVTRRTTTGPGAPTGPQVLGSTLNTDTFTFDERLVIPMRDRAENVHGIFFNSSATDTFDLVIDGGAPGNPQLRPDQSVTFQAGFDVDFADWNKVTVEELPVTLAPASPVFETEVVTFSISGVAGVTYSLRLPAAGGIGTISGMTYTAPVLAAGTPSANQGVEVYATYDLNHPIFGGAGQARPTRLTPNDLTNFCRAVQVQVNQLTLPTGLTVKTGESVEFDVSIEPSGIGNATPTPPGAAIPARVEVVTRGRPTRLRFVAPAGVTAPTAVSVPLTFGSSVTRVLNLSVQVTL